MTVQTAPARRPASRPVKSLLAAHSHETTAVARTRTDTTGTWKSPPDASIADFCDYLRATNNRNGRPYDTAGVVRDRGIVGAGQMHGCVEVRLPQS